MSRITLAEGLLLNLAEKIRPGRHEYIPKHEAYLKLKTLTGQDFGYDVKRWREWLKRTERRTV